MSYNRHDAVCLEDPCRMCRVWREEFVRSNTDNCTTPYFAEIPETVLPRSPEVAVQQGKP